MCTSKYNIDLRQMKYHIDMFKSFWTNHAFMRLSTNYSTVWFRRIEKNLAVILFIVTTSILMSKCPHKLGVLLESTIFDHIWNHFHRINQLYQPKNAQKWTIFSFVKINTQVYQHFNPMYNLVWINFEHDLKCLGC